MSLKAYLKITIYRIEMHFIEISYSTLKKSVNQWTTNETTKTRQAVYL